MLKENFFDFKIVFNCFEKKELNLILLLKKKIIKKKEINFFQFGCGCEHSYIIEKNGLKK
jgi:hypothetical protein